MNSLKIAREIIREHFAGKEEDLKTDTRPAVQRRRYYFFDAKPENSIKFTALKEVLESNSPEKEATIQKSLLPGEMLRP